jgi:hypothetical protein
VSETITTRGRGKLTKTRSLQETYTSFHSQISSFISKIQLNDMWRSFKNRSYHWFRTLETRSFRDNPKLVRYVHIEIVKSVSFWSYQHQLCFFFGLVNLFLLTILDLISDSLAYTVQLLCEAYCCFDNILADFWLQLCWSFVRFSAWELFSIFPSDVSQTHVSLVMSIRMLCEFRAHYFLII